MEMRIDKVELSGSIDRRSRGIEEAGGKALDSLSLRRKIAGALFRRNRPIVKNREVSKLSVAHLGVQGFVHDGVLKGHLIRAHGLAADTLRIAQADGAVGIDMYIAETNIVRIGNAHRIRKRLFHVC